MPFTLKELLPDNQILQAVKPSDLVTHAIDVMHRFGYSQLPVIEGEKGLSNGQALTFESILQAIQSLSADLESLQVKDASRVVKTHPPDADLLSTLNDIQHNSFILIVDQTNILEGIVTTADIAHFFQEYAQDLMIIEGIESIVKETISSLFNDESEKKAAIEAVTGHQYNQIRKRLPNAIKAYFHSLSVEHPNSNNIEALHCAERNLGILAEAKPFEGLSFNEYIQVLLHHSDPLGNNGKKGELKNLLEKVRDSRNQLAHFRGELTLSQRRSLHFASEWLERNFSATSLLKCTESKTKAFKVNSQEIKNDQGPLAIDLTEQENEQDPPTGSYADLTKYLSRISESTTSFRMTFRNVEKILGKPLPSSAYLYRAWWDNNNITPQAASWVEEDWSTAAVDMARGELSFLRKNTRKLFYVRFFEDLNERLINKKEFNLYEHQPKGANWQALAHFKWTRRKQAAGIFATFTRYIIFRIYLYLDCGNKERNEAVFDRMLSEKSVYESKVGCMLSWERREEFRACRIAAFTLFDINQLSDIDQPEKYIELLDWAEKTSLDFYEAFSEYFLRNHSSRNHAE